MTIFSKSSEVKIKISKEAISSMRSFKQNKRGDVEAGGFLIGRYIINSNDIVVDDVTIPDRNDSRTRFSFTKDHQRHLRLLKSIWKKSGGSSIYLGEWHTHPEKSPNPSSFDFDEWNKILIQGKFEASRILFIIIGLSEIALWVGIIKNKEIVYVGRSPI